MNHDGGICHASDERPKRKGHSTVTRTAYQISLFPCQMKNWMLFSFIVKISLKMANNKTQQGINKSDDTVKRCNMINCAPSLS